MTQFKERSQLGLFIAVIALGFLQSDAFRIDEPRADDVFFSCNFDQGNCGFIIDEPSATHMSFQNQVDVSGYTYTDASYLYKPALNGKSCQIPFTIGANEYYKCTENDECETGGELAKCPAAGNFLSVKSVIGDAYFAEAVYTNLIRIPTFGIYQLSFYAFMYCDHETCGDIEDFVKFYLNHGPSPVYHLHAFQIGFQTFDQTKKKAWGRFEISFPFQITKEITLSIAAGRDVNGPNVETFFGIDDIQLTYISELPQITLASTSRASTPSTQPAVVDYSCDFDLSDCNVVLVPGSDELIKVDKNLMAGNYRFTDRSSITSATQNGQKCIIPFNIGPTEYYHCSIDNDCETPSGFAKCNEGHLTWPQFEHWCFVSVDKGESHYAEVTFPQITLRDRGVYRLSLWSFYYCEGNPCTEAKDFIKIYLKHGNSILPEVFSLNTSYFEKPWKQETFIFNATTPILKMDINAGRDFAVPGLRSYFGIDDITIEYIGLIPEVSTTPTTLAPEPVLYNCDFDQENCGFVIDEDSATHLSIQKQVDVGGYVFTDASYLYTPTSNGQKCQIPFTFNGNEYYKCNEADQCQTGSGLATCPAAGNFMSVQSVIGAAYFSEAVAQSPIRIQTFGRYRFSFYAFMYCDHETCTDIEDFIKFYLNHGPSPIFHVHSYQIGFKNFDQTKKKAWVRFESTFEFRITKEIILSLVAGRDYDGPNVETFFGIDDIQLTFVEELSQITLATTSRASTTTTKDTPVEYICDFDSSDCNAILVSGSDELIKVDKNLKAGNYWFTDRTSITSSTANGQKCIIPFFIGPTEYYHCSIDNDCETPSGLAKCNEGRFLYGMSLESGQSHYAEVTFPTILLRDIGLFRLSLWSFYYCEGKPCTDAQEFIKVFLNHGDNLVLQTEVFYLNTSYFERPWKQETFIFNATTPQLIMSITAGRDNSFPGLRSYFGIDDIMIEYLGPIPETVTTTTTSTTTRTIVITTSTNSADQSPTVDLTTLEMTTSKKKSNLGTVLPAVLIPLAAVFAIAFSLFYTKKNGLLCFKKNEYLKEVKMSSISGFNDE